MATSLQRSPLHKGHFSATANTPSTATSMSFPVSMSFPQAIYQHICRYVHNSSHPNFKCLFLASWWDCSQKYHNGLTYFVVIIIIIIIFIFILIEDTYYYPGDFRQVAPRTRRKEFSSISAEDPEEEDDSEAEKQVFLYPKEGCTRAFQRHPPLEKHIAFGTCSKAI